MSDKPDIAKLRALNAAAALGPWTIVERERFLRVTAMCEADAKALAMPDAVKVIYEGQADCGRYKFGARTYMLFSTLDDYNAYLREN